MTLTFSLPAAPDLRRFRSVLTTPIVRTVDTRTSSFYTAKRTSLRRASSLGPLRELTDSGSGDVVIDVAAVAFIDPATDRVLAVGQQLLDSRGRKVTFRSPPRLVARILALFSLADLIEAEGRSDP